MFGEFVEIPKIFRPSDGREYFEKCLVCGADLLSGDRYYFIEKAVRRYANFSATDAIFEYAICETCAEKAREEFSLESKENLRIFFEKNLAFDSLVDFSSGKPLDIETRLARCMITRRPIADSDEYAIAALCKGRRAAISLFPYAVSEKALEAINEELSNKTRDFLEGFKNNYLGVPPELRKILDPKIILI